MNSPTASNPTYGNYQTVYKDTESKPLVLYTQNIQTIYPPHTTVLSQFNQYLSDYALVVVKAWAPWCEPCKEASKRFNEIIQSIRSTFPSLFMPPNPKVIFLDDNIEEEDSIHRNRVNAIPTFFYYSSIQNQNITDSFSNIDFNPFVNVLQNLCQSLVQQQRDPSSSPTTVQYHSSS